MNQEYCLPEIKNHRAGGFFIIRYTVTKYAVKSFNGVYFRKGS